MTKLLIVTQTVDDADPILGFFTRWVETLALRFKSVEVICLFEGTHALPENVRVHTLGKEEAKRSEWKTGRRIKYSARFLALLWKLRREYDVVLVHMNQEYVLLGAPLWKLLGKRISLWRNHGSGSFLTRLSVALSRNVFYTSSASYTARFPNAVRMPVGIDLARFTGASDGGRIPGSLLMVGRVAPKKHVREVVEALIALKKDGIEIPLTLVGPMDEVHYRDDVVGLATAGGVGLSVRGPVAHTELPRVYQEHDIVVNVSEPGMFDKTMLEALASGSLLLTRHEDLAGELDTRLRTTGEVPDIATKLRVLVALSEAEKEALRVKGKEIAARHSLEALVARLSRELYA